MNFSNILFILSFAFSNLTFANLIIPKKQADHLATEYSQLQFQKSNSSITNYNHSNQNCMPVDKVSCTEFLCNKVGTCHYQSTFQEIAESCRGSSGDCVELICNKVGNCNYISTAKEAAQACISTNSECATFGCEKIGTCGYMSNAKQIAIACKGVLDASCVRYGCNRTGGCGYMSNFEQIARSCAGN